VLQAVFCRRYRAAPLGEIVFDGLTPLGGLCRLGTSGTEGVFCAGMSSKYFLINPKATSVLKSRPK
jgi:hypothetical protein